MVLFYSAFPRRKGRSLGKRGKNKAAPFYRGSFWQRSLFNGQEDLVDLFELRGDCDVLRAVICTGPTLDAVVGVFFFWHIGKIGVAGDQVAFFLLVVVIDMEDLRDGDAHRALCYAVAAACAGDGTVF